ncbi:MAG: ABC transporter permease [Lentisphaerae bacterium]|nr:ABC transporter permease [Lentisphaerota bacterium]
MNLIKIAFAGLAERRARTLIAVLSISIGIASFIILTGLAGGFQKAVKNTYADRGTDIIIYEKDKPTIVTSVIGQEVLVDISTFTGVKEVSGVVMDFMKLNGRRVIAYGWESSSFLFKDKNIKSGRKFRDGAMEVMLGDIAARNFGKTVGDSIRIGKERFEVVGIYSSRSLFERGSILLPIGELQRIKSAKDKLTIIDIVAREDKDPHGRQKELTRLKEAIKAKYPYLAVETSDELFSEESDMLPMAQGIAWAISVVALAMAIVGTMNVIMMSVLEKTREIGILMAVGWSRLKIFRLIVYESLIISMIGGVAGIVLGFMALEYLLTFPLLEGLIEISYSIGRMTAVWLAVIIVGVLSAIYPAIKAMTLSIVEALRYE